MVPLDTTKMEEVAFSIGIWRAISNFLKMVTEDFNAQEISYEPEFSELCRTCGYQQNLAQVFADLGSEITACLPEAENAIVTIELMRGQLRIIHSALYLLLNTYYTQENEEPKYLLAIGLVHSVVNRIEQICLEELQSQQIN